MRLNSWPARIGMGAACLVLGGITPVCAAQVFDSLGGAWSSDGGDGLMRLARSFERSDAPWIGIPVRCDVVDFAARRAEFHQLSVAQIPQGYLQSATIASILKSNPVPLKNIGDSSPGAALCLKNASA